MKGLEAGFILKKYASLNEIEAGLMQLFMNACCIENNPSLIFTHSPTQATANHSPKPISAYPLTHLPKPVPTRTNTYSFNHSPTHALTYPPTQSLRPTLTH